MSNVQVKLEHRCVEGPHVLARALDQGMLLLNLQTGALFELNRTGARLWALIRHSPTVGNVVDTILASQRTVPRDTIERDVLRLLGDLAREGLLVVAAPEPIDVR